MKKALTYKGVVLSNECDSNRHLNVMYYINKFEHAGHCSNLELGLSHGKEEPNRGIVVLEQNIKYFQELLEDDLVYIESTLLDIGNKTFTILHEMFNGRTCTLASSMKVVLVLFDKTTRKSMPFPAHLKSRLISLLNEE